MNADAEICLCAELGNHAEEGGLICMPDERRLN